MNRSRPRILLGITGSVAAVKAPELVRLFKDKGYDVTCFLTRSAEKFVSKLALATLSGEPALSDMFGSEAYQMPHIRLTNESDLLLIAPASVTILGRCAYGLAEDLVTLSYLTTTKPVIMAPAM